MAIHPLNFGQFASKRFLRPTNHVFAAKDAMVPLVAQEFPKAALSLPIGFVAVGAGFAPVAVLGLQPGKNLLVNHEGRWLGEYIPAVYRGYPFLLADAEDGRQVLCVNDTDGVVSETEGEYFFGLDEQPTEAIKEVLNFLTQLASNRAGTLKVIAVLQKHQLISPWPIKLQSADQQEQNVEGLYRIDEVALNSLPAEVFEQIRQTGALPLIYCQLLSMQHLPTLGKLAQAQHEVMRLAALSEAEAAEFDMTFLADDTTISFNNL